MSVKFRIPEIIFGALLTVAIFAMGFVVASSMPPPNQQIEKADHPQAANEGPERTAEKQIAYYTKWLAWFTGALVAVSGIQGYFLLRADNTARIAAEAAVLGSRAAIALQLPIIRVEPHTLGNGQSFDGKTLTESCSVHFLTLFNLGSTKAFPVEIRCGWTIGDKLPDEPTLSVSETFPPNLILEPDPKAVERRFLQFNMPLKPGEWSLISEGKLPLWFYCSLGYDDFMGERHDAVFCWRWQDIGFGMDWRVDATPAYNRKT